MIHRVVNTVGFFVCTSRKHPDFKKFQTCMSKTIYFLEVLDIIGSRNSGGAL
jgi:hypothetical protein